LARHVTHMVEVRCTWKSSKGNVTSYSYIYGMKYQTDLCRKRCEGVD